VIPSPLFAAVHTIPDPPLPFWTFFVATVIKMVVVFTVYLVGVALLTLAERKISAWIQGRLGPNRVGGTLGLLQPAADGVKNFMKEETLPTHVNKPLFTLAPMLAFIPALMAAAVIPFGAPWDSRWGRISMVVADLPVGFLFTLAITSLGVYGIVLAGWSSNNKYALLGGLRSSAQMVSYEIAMGMSLIPVLLLAGNVTLNEIVDQQANMHIWNVLTLTISFFLFMVAAFAETNRLPFDLPEAESELIAGYHTEYSAMKFSMFPISEYANMATSSALMATLFFGGWDIPFTTRDNTTGVAWYMTLLSIAIFGLKTLFFLFVFIWIRWTLPRFRYDQLMSLGWKTMLPLALAYIVIVAATILGLDYLGLERGFLYGLAMLAVNAVLVVIVFFILDRGRIISPAYGRASPQQISRLRAVTAARSHLSPQSGD
jgi:NADH-quinone oxidoreductase subunit H